MRSSGPQVVLVRHGETEWSRNGRHTSFTDLPLTLGGEREANSLKECLSHWAFHLALSSPRARALRTAELAGWGGRVVGPVPLLHASHSAFHAHTALSLDRHGWSGLSLARADWQALSHARRANPGAGGAAGLQASQVRFLAHGEHIAHDDTAYTLGFTDGDMIYVVEEGEGEDVAGET